MKGKEYYLASCDVLWENPKLSLFMTGLRNERGQ